MKTKKSKKVVSKKSKKLAEITQDQTEMKAIKKDCLTAIGILENTEGFDPVPSSAYQYLKLLVNSINELLKKSRSEKRRLKALNP